MSENQAGKSLRPHLLWVYSGALEGTLSASTWLRPTRELRQMGWKVTLVASGPAGPHSVEGVEIFGITHPEIYLLRQMIYHLKVIRFALSNWDSTDVILFNQPSAIWLLPLRLVRDLKNSKLPLLVMDTRTVPMEDWRKASWRDRLRAYFYNSMNRLANSWADGQTAITQRMADCVKILPAHLWGVWPSGAEVELFTPACTARQWPDEGQPVHITYIGVLHYERNLMALCQAVEMARAEGMNFVLTLTGFGTEQADLQKFASQTEGRIRVNDAVPHDQVPALLAQVHIGALPFPDEQKYAVSSPVKLFEYMAAGLPILATRIACHTDVIGDGCYAFWAEGSSPESLLAALRQAWNARAALKTMGQEAAHAANAWTWQESARKLSEALLWGLRNSKSDHGSTVDSQ